MKIRKSQSAENKKPLGKENQQNNLNLSVPSIRVNPPKGTSLNRISEEERQKRILKRQEEERKREEKLTKELHKSKIEKEKEKNMFKQIKLNFGVQEETKN